MSASGAAATEEAHWRRTLVSTAYVWVEWNSLVAVDPEIVFEVFCDVLCVDVAWYVAPLAVVPDVFDVCAHMRMIRHGNL